MNERTKGRTKQKSKTRKKSGKSQKPIAADQTQQEQGTTGWKQGRSAGGKHWKQFNSQPRRVEKLYWRK